MSFTDQLIALCPPDVFYNDLDKQAITLCLHTNNYVRRYKGNPCVPQDTRMTLDEHIYDMIDSFLRLPETQHILKQSHKNSPEWNFVIQTLRVILRHDLGESIFEPQTYLQKVDPNLPKINAGYFEEAVTKHIYHLAQHAVISNKQKEFLNAINGMQRQYDHFDVESSAKTGQEYADYLYAHFDEAISELQKLHKALPPITDSALVKTIQKNDLQHFHDYEQIENPEVQKTSPAGIFTKIIDTGAQLEDMRYEVDKLQNPALPYKNLSRQPSNYILILIRRSEKFLLPFIRMVQENAYLSPFLKPAYEMAYTRIAAGSLLLRPYTFLQTQPQEPGLLSNDNEHDTFNRNMLQKIAARRQTIPALKDDEILSNLEVAAKALTYRQILPDLQKSMLDDPVPADDAFRALFDKTLAELQSDRTTEARIARVHAVCNGRLSFYA